MKLPVINNSTDGLPTSNLMAALLSGYHSARTRSRVRCYPDSRSGFLSEQDDSIFCPPIRYMPREMHRLALDYFMPYGKPPLNGTVFDVGGGMGTELPTYSRLVGAQGKVLTFEAHPKSFNILERIIKLNNLENVQAYNCAVWSENTELLISDNPDSLGVNSIIDGAQLAFGTIPVPATTLDQIADDNGVSRVDFMKVNIEGAEVQALQGAEQLLLKTGLLTVCCHDFVHNIEGGSSDMCTKSQVKEILLDLGFEVFERKDDPRPPVRDTLYGRRHS